MAIDKAVDSAVLDANLTSIADAIRAKAGTSDKLAFPAGFADAIAAIVTGPPGEFTLSTAGFTRGASGTLILDEDTEGKGFNFDMGFVCDTEKPCIMGLISVDEENIYSETYRTAQHILQYDSNQRSSHSTTFGVYVCLKNDGSYYSGVTGKIKTSSVDIAYAYKRDTLIKAYLSPESKYRHFYLNGMPDYNECYLMAGKEYKWFVLANEK